MRGLHSWQRFGFRLSKIDYFQGPRKAETRQAMRQNRYNQIPGNVIVICVPPSFMPPTLVRSLPYSSGVCAGKTTSEIQTKTRWRRIRWRSHDRGCF